MKRGLNININFTNRFIYTFVAFILILITGVVVFALTPGEAPSPGHLVDEFAPPSGCETNQVLQWDGTNWVCTDFSAGLWTAIGGNIYYNLGNIGIGTTTPQEKLDVVGNIKASGNINAGGTICDINGCIGSGSSIYTGPLVNGVHTGLDCLGIGGVPVDDGQGNSFCKSSGGACPFGWSQYQSWSSTSAKTCTGLNACVGTRSCTTGEHEFATGIAVETCSYPDSNQHPDLCKTTVCSAGAEQIGCY